MKTKTKQSDIHILELSSYEKPEIREEANKDFVSLGVDNNYYQDVIDRYVGSTTNHSAINGIVNQIYGKGIGALNAHSKPDEYVQMLSIFRAKDVRCVVQDLKILGEGAFQLTYKGKKIVKATHFPRQTLRAEKCNDKGEVEAYYYHHNWSEYKTSDKLTRIPVFNSSKKAKKENEILIIRKYVTGFHYYSLPDYCASLPYALLEEHIATYQINDCENGFSGTSIINFANGIPDKEKRENIKSNVLNKLTGAAGDKVIVSFNPDKDSATTVEQLSLNDAPQHYEYLSRECTSKIMLGHRITSPLLLGLRDGNGGLGSNSDEIETASLLFDNVTIKPYQNLMIEAMDEVLAVNDIALKIYFKTIQPLEFIDTTNAITNEQKEEETGLEFSEERPELSEEDGKSIANDLISLGQDEDELLKEYNLIDESAVDYEDEVNFDEIVNELNNPKKSLFSKFYEFISTGVNKPKEDSEQDGTSKQSVAKLSKFLVRYVYSPQRTSSDSRQFCKDMVSAKKVYRKEDILAMTRKKVNPDFCKKGKKGTGKYSIWLYKGGARCSHKWYRKTYLRKWDDKGMGKAITSGEAKSLGFKFPKNARYVSVAPKDQQYEGYTRKYWDKMQRAKNKKNK